MDDLGLAEYYFDYAQSCLSLGYEHEAAIYMSDCWHYLVCHFFQPLI